MRILGIESSCDETAAAVIEDGRKMLSNVVASSVDLHAAYGGVVPEIAARSHLEVILPTIDEALKTAATSWEDIDAIAVTYGPGLGGSLLIGVLTARTLAILKKKPLQAVNHVLAHVYAAFITDSPLPSYVLPDAPPKFPLLALIVSGGHTQLVVFSNHSEYQILGKTADDAVGEAFDKVAKITGLPYPGGPSVAAAAKNGNPETFKLPDAKLANPYDFSFSGLKTAVLRASQQAVGKDFTLPSTQLPALLSEAQKADIAASFQKAAVATLVDKLEAAYREYKPASVVVCGGVAANQALRDETSRRLGGLTDVIFTDIKLCTDNAAMIAARGYYQMQLNTEGADPYSLEISPSLAM